MKKLERCLWIINTLIDYGEASLKELNERFRNYSLNYDKDVLNEKTFSRDREYIASIFQMDIDFNFHIGKYQLINTEKLQNNELYRYLLSSIHVNNLSSMAIQYKDKIMLDEAPTGVEWLHVILNAISKKLNVTFEYTSYYERKHSHFEVIPCFVRMFEHRWYLIAEFMDHTGTRVLALERMTDLKIGEKECEASPEITPERFFEGCYGIYRDQFDIEETRLKVYNQQVSYFRSLPLHSSQKEIETGKDYVVFQYFLRPSYDLVQRILMQGDNVEVLQPASLREEIKEKIQDLTDLYSTE